MLSMLSRDANDRPNLDELLDQWAPIAQTAAATVTETDFLASSGSA